MRLWRRWRLSRGSFSLVEEVERLFIAAAAVGIISDCAQDGYSLGRPISAHEPLRREKSNLGYLRRDLMGEQRHIAGVRHLLASHRHAVEGFRIPIKRRHVVLVEPIGGDEIVAGMSESRSCSVAIEIFRVAKVGKTQEEGSFNIVRVRGQVWLQDRACGLTIAGRRFHARQKHLREPVLRGGRHPLANSGCKTRTAVRGHIAARA